jgi:hypothetical protein
MTCDLHQALERRRQDHEDLMTALGLDDDDKIAMRAAASAMAKATAVSAIAHFVQSRRPVDPEAPAPD